jgi:hypothetical protein
LFLEFLSFRYRNRRIGNPALQSIDFKAELLHMEALQQLSGALKRLRRRSVDVHR